MKQIRVCGGTGCLSAHSDKVRDKFVELLPDTEITFDVKLTGCRGFCSQGPVVMVDDTFYTNVSVDSVEKIVEKHIKNDEIVEELLYSMPHSDSKVSNFIDIPFYSKQKRLILANCGIIDPDKIDDYIDIGGYTGLKNALSMKPEEIIDQIKSSGLRGRGGAGFPTGLKWEFARKAKGNPKYVIINADEGDPGAFMDGSILEGDPHSVIEGITIGAYAIGASRGIIYVRAEYPLSIKRFGKAVNDARERGFLGDNILDSGFSFDIDIYEGAGAFVCGEETALIKSVEGNRGVPVLKPPFPATSGLWGKPTNINNVKTWSAVAWIMRNGWEEFRKIGTEKSAGTAIFSLTGKINNSGVIEVPMGTTLREIIFDIGGGIQGGNEFKAVQTGGPSGGCIPASLLDTPVDYENMAAIGSIMGSGGMVVIDTHTCIVDFAKFFLSFTQKESCGKCTPCREGTLRLKQLLEKITEGKATMNDLEELEKLAHIVKETSLCGLGQTAPNPVLSTLRYFREEYIEHIVDKKCRAGVCDALIDLEIDPDGCKTCGICQDNCPTDAISGVKGEWYSIDNNTCIGCKTCITVCPTNTIKIL